MSDIPDTPVLPDVSPVGMRMLELATGLTNLQAQYERHGSISDTGLAALLEGINDLIRAGEYDVNHRSPADVINRLGLVRGCVASAEGQYGSLNDAG